MNVPTIALAASIAITTAAASAQKAPSHVETIQDVSRHKNDIATGTELTVKGDFLNMLMPSDACLSHLTWHTQIQHGEVDPCQDTRWAIALSASDARGNPLWPAVGLTCDLTQAEWWKINHNYHGNFTMTVRGRYAKSLDFDAVGHNLPWHVGVAWLVNCSVVSIEARPRTQPSYAPAPDDAAKKTAELKDAQAAATEKITEIMPQYKQAIAQLAQTTLQLHQQYQQVLAQKQALERTSASPTPTQQQLAEMRREVQEEGPAAFALKDGNNVMQAIAAHNTTIQKCDEQMKQIAQQEVDAGQTVSQLSSQLLTQQMTLRGRPAVITVDSTDYRTLTLHMADAAIQREIGVIEQVIHGPDNEACVTEIDTDTRICTTYSYLSSQGLIGDYSVIARKAGSTSYEVSTN